MIVPSVAGRFVYQLIDRPFLDVVSYIVKRNRFGTRLQLPACRDEVAFTYSSMHNAER